MTLFDRIQTSKTLENRAQSIVTFETELVPGLFPTVPYMQTLMSEVGRLDEVSAQRRITGSVYGADGCGGRTDLYNRTIS